eukprot:12884598-Prorocentrum_lima.AAC.1
MGSPIMHQEVGSACQFLGRKQTAREKHCSNGVQASTAKCRTSKDLNACRKQLQRRDHHKGENTSIQDG